MRLALLVLQVVGHAVANFSSETGRPKGESVADKRRAINPESTMRPRPERLRAANTLTVLRDYDFIDATDNVAAKFLLADACHLAGTPYSHAGVLRFKGQTMTARPGQTTCYRCLFEACRRRAPRLHPPKRGRVLARGPA